MAHLICVTHGKRSVVLTDSRTAQPIVRHRTNHDNECSSVLLTFKSRIVYPQEVIESTYNDGLAEWITDRDYSNAFAKVLVDLNEVAPVEKLEEDINVLKSKLEGKWKNKSLKRVGRRGK